MANVNFSVVIDDSKLNITMDLKGQDLYFFNERSQVGKETWLKDYVRSRSKIEDIVIKP